MNKKVKSYIIILAMILLLAGCEQEVVLDIPSLIDKDYNDIDINSINHYKIEVDLDQVENCYVGRQWSTYVNNTGKILGELYFHIYPNAFKDSKNSPILFNRQFKDSASYKEGGIEINKLYRGSKELAFNIEGEGETILHIKLDEPLLPGEKTEIYLEYRVELPTVIDRFGYSDRIINMGNWYPIACVYDHKGWNLDPYYDLGDPFYSDIANYDVSINTHKDMVIATSGNIISEEIIEDRKVYNIEGKLIRDFAWVASKDFKIAEREVEGTVVKLYYLDKNSAMVKHSLNAGENSIRIFNRIFGRYPYGSYSIVMTEFPSGMEYPGIVFINKDYSGLLSKNILEQVIVHETAHQWWYGLVGNDQIHEAWLDEALASYSEVIYYKEMYGEDRGEEYFIQNIEMGYEYGRSYLRGDRIVKKPLDEFTNWDDYGILVYIKGAMFLDEIKGIYGEEVLYKILKTYFEKYKFYNATTEDFIQVCEEITKSDFSNLTEIWLYK